MELLRSVPPLPSTERGSFCSISTDRAGERLLYGSGSNVIWRPVASLTQGTEKAEEIFCWRGHVKNVTCAQMSPNGQWVASGVHEDLIINLWEVELQHTDGLL